MTYKLGTLIRATSHDSKVIIAGRYVSDGFDVRHNPVMVIEQSNGVYGYVSNRDFWLEEIKMSSIDLDIRELVAYYLKEGYSKEYILMNIRIAWENMRDPQPELKGEMDT